MYDRSKVIREKDVSLVFNAGNEHILSALQFCADELVL
jgi:hypothetical protein